MGDVPDDRVIAEAVARAGRADFERWLARVHAAGCCTQPVRLAGHVNTVDTATGERTVTYTTAGEPDHVLYKACETRRATRCAACAAVYQGDARALILAGLAGGKGVDQTVAGHPCVFATLTAPSFGPVHTAGPGRCHPPACDPAGSCPHRLAPGCGTFHLPGDTAIGTPICADCYDYPGTVIFNATAGQLWNRTVIALRRRLAHQVGLPARTFDQLHVVSYVKVVEYQRRGVVHLHALIRVDRRNHPDPPDIDADNLANATRDAGLRAAVPHPLAPGASIQWGTQLDVTPVNVDDRRTSAAYLAKYATKSTDDAGALDRRLHSPDTSHLQLPGHYRLLVTTAFQLAGRADLVHLNLAHWAHTLGYRGHWLTKSRHWSTTFGALREARHQWHINHHATTGDGDQKETVGLGDWQYKGVGYANSGDSWLATSAAEIKRVNRRTAWEERS